MKSVVRGVLVAVCALVVVGVAQAKEKRAPTEIGVSEAPAGTINVQLSGSFKGCLRERIVTFSDGSGDLFHTAKTNRRAAVSLGLDEVPPAISGLRIAAPESRFANRVCEAGNAELPVDFVTLDGGVTGGLFGGVLFSSIEACEPGRTISVYEISADPAFAGFDVTDASGVWSIAAAPGVYEARAERIFVQGPEGLTMCQRAVSFPWSYEEPVE